MELDKRVTELATCPICLDDFKNAKFLPCHHSFCLKCMQGHCKGKLTGDDVPCPVCREKFQIPSGGLEALPHDFVLQKLLDVRYESSKIPEGVPCKVGIVDKDVRDSDGLSSAFRDEVRSTSTRDRPSYCGQHREERLKLYCYDCEQNVCLMCFAVDHGGHKCGEIDKVAADFTQLLDWYITDVSSRVCDFQEALRQAEDETANFHNSVTANETAAHQRISSVRQLIDDHVRQLLDKLNVEKSAGTKEVTGQKEELMFALTALESFQSGVEELKSKGSSCDITGAAKTMRLRVNELLQTYTVPDAHEAPRIVFTGTDFDELANNGQNIIGRIDVHSTDQSGQPETHLQTVRERQLEDELNKTEEREQRLQAELNKAADTERELRYRVQQLSSTQRILNSDARVVHTLNFKGHNVIGVTTLDDKVYVLRSHATKSNIDIYSGTDLDQLSCLTTPGIPTAKDIASCERHRCLYILTSYCVHRNGLNGSVTEWYVPGSTLGLSLTPDGNVLVLAVENTTSRPSRAPYFLLEMCSETGQIMNFVTLQLSGLKEGPHHAVKMTNGQFVVCYCNRGLFQFVANGTVSIFDEHGRLVRSYANVSGSATRQLSTPRHLAVDNDCQFIIVADSENNLVLLLTARLEFIRCLVNGLPGKPTRLHIDNDTRRLYVGQDNGDVVVVAL